MQYRNGCVNSPEASLCFDGNECNVDTCDSLTGCTYSTLVCDDNDPCTTDSCDNTVGCVFTEVNCDDGVSCTLDTCDAGGCFNSIGCVV